MKKILYAALIVFALSFMPCGAVSADEALADSMAPGTWMTNPRYITFGEYNGHALKWRVLEVYTSDGVTGDDNVSGHKTAFLVLDDVLRNADATGTVYEMLFESNWQNKGNNFPVSEIFTFLKDTFLPHLADYQDGILTAKYKPDNGSYTWFNGQTEASSQVFLLSVGEALKPEYFKDTADRDVGHAYWLRSPGYGSGNAALVWSGGAVDDGYDVFYSSAVRPALKINLSSLGFTSELVSYPPEGE